MKASSTLVIIILGLLSVQSLSGQIPEIKADQTLRVYLEGEIEDFNYTRRNLTFVDFVNLEVRWVSVSILDHSITIL